MARAKCFLDGQAPVHRDRDTKSSGRGAMGSAERSSAHPRTGPSRENGARYCKRRGLWAPLFFLLGTAARSLCARGGWSRRVTVTLDQRDAVGEISIHLHSQFIFNLKQSHY